MIVKKKGILLWQPNTNLELDHPLVRSVNFRFLAIIASYSHRLHKQHDWVGGCMIQSFYTNQFISSACFLTLCFHTCGCVSKTLQEMRKLSRSLSDCYITKLLLMSLSFSLSLSSVYDNSAVRWRCWNQNVTDSLHGWLGQLLRYPGQLKRQVWIFKEKIYEIWKCFQCVHIGSSLPEVECLDNLSSLYLLISIPFVAFPICPPTLWGKKLSMMAFVKRDKSKATVVFRRKRQKVQLQNTEGKGNSHCMIKRKFLEINFHKIPFPPPFRRGHCPARRKNHQSTRPQYL